jgi:hypothetical protein
MIIFQPMYNFYVNHILPKAFGCAFTPNGLAAVVVLNEKFEPPPVVVVMAPNPDFPKKLPLCCLVLSNTPPELDPNPAIMMYQNLAIKHV